MKKSRLTTTALLATLACGGAAVLLTTSCSKSSANTGITPQKMADALHAVMDSDRAVYTGNVVNRLQNEEKVIKASEHWKDDKALPLPAQMFRMGAELVQEKDAGFTYALLSKWPVNKQNAPKTAAEIAGLDAVASNGGSAAYSTEEVIAGKKYFTGVYADIAASPACVKCHNDHPDTPRDDFKLGDVMGGVVIRIPIE